MVQVEGLVQSRIPHSRQGCHKLGGWSDGGLFERGLMMQKVMLNEQFQWVHSWKGEISGAGEGIRTLDLRFTKPLLCH